MSHSGKGLVTATVQVLRPRFEAPPVLRSRLVQLAADTAASDMGGVMAILRPQYEAPPELRSRLVQLATDTAASDMGRAMAMLQPRFEAPAGLRSGLVQLAVDTAAPGPRRGEIKASSVRPLHELAVKSVVEPTETVGEGKSQPRKSVRILRMASIVLLLLVGPLGVCANFPLDERTPMEVKEIAESASPTLAVQPNVTAPAIATGTLAPLPTGTAPKPVKPATSGAKIAAPSIPKVYCNKFGICIKEKRISSPNLHERRDPSKKPCRAAKFGPCVPD